MADKMIEDGDRGVTLNKTLAWTVLVSFLSGSFWIGVQVASAGSAIEVLMERQIEDRQAIRANTSAIYAQTADSARYDQRLLGIEDEIKHARSTTEKILQELRKLAASR